MEQNQTNILEQNIPTKTKGRRIYLSHLRRVRRHVRRIHLSQDQKRDGQGVLFYGKKVPTNIRISQPASAVYRNMREDASMQLAFMY
jgi:hypothetical protein